jgi:spore germination protein YaaH
MRLTTVPTRPHRTVLLRTLIAAAFTAVLLAPPTQAAALPPPGPAAIPDPTIGPNMAQNAQFGATAEPQSTDPSMHAQGMPQTWLAPRVASASASTTGLNKEVFGFAPYWALPNWREWQLNLVSTVAYFSVPYDANGTPMTGEPGWSGWQSQNLTDLVNATHAAGHRAVLTLTAGGNASDTTWSIVSDPAKSAAVTNSAVSLMHQRGLDGICIDFEGTTANQYPGIQGDFTNFTHQMQSALGGASLFVATYSGSASWSGGIFNIHDLAPYVTAFFDMAYDMASGNTWGNASPNAPLNGYTYNDTASVNQYIQQAGDPSKVILGVPYYGYKWTVTSNGPHAAVKSGTSLYGSAETYGGVASDVFGCSCASQFSYGWDDQGASPWASWWSSDLNSWREMYYENTSSLGAKYDLVNSSSIRGVGIWALGYDSGTTDLWSLLAQKFGPPSGYWMVARDGGVFPFGRAGGYGSTGNVRLNQPMVGMAGTPSGHGYWLVASDGGIFPFGDAGGYGSTGDKRLNKPIVGMASTPSGHGYWLVASDGGIFCFGDAGFRGSTGGQHLNQPVVGMAPTASGQGYWLVAADGGIFPFGDAGGWGSHGGAPLNQPIVGMAASRSGNGYWLVASDGGIFPYGDAGGHGSTGNLRLNQPIVGMAATASGNGYWLVASDGGIFTFGDAPFLGSTGGQHLNQPVVGMGAMALLH